RPGEIVLVHIIAHDDKIIIQGGDLGSVVGVSGVGDIAMLDMKVSNMSWYVPTATGPTPSQRFAHSAVMVGTVAFILFGQLNNNTLDNNIYALDTATWTWLQTYNPSHLEYTKTGNIINIIQNPNSTAPKLPVPAYIPTYTPTYTPAYTSTYTSTYTPKDTIIGIVSGGVALLLIAAICFIVYKRRETRRAAAAADAAAATNAALFPEIPPIPTKYENNPQRYSSYSAYSWTSNTTVPPDMS
ncbi:hypothetical protein BC938DRAFT_480542, partial [Jimgerdemannia flammicorona]